MEVVFLAGNFWDFFRRLPAVFRRKEAEKTRSHRKKSKNFRVVMLLRAMSRSFLQDMVIFPATSGRLLQYPVSGIVDLGTCLLHLVISKFLLLMNIETVQ